MTAVPNGREAWITAGQTLLISGGVAAVRLQALVHTSGLTTEDFYRHFSSLPHFLEDLARYFGTTLLVTALDEAESPDPRTRLRRLSELATSEHVVPVNSAMRDWASTDPIAAEAVRRADHIALRFAERAFLDLGYEAASAQTRAILFCTAHAARLTTPWPTSARDADELVAALAP